MATARVPDPEPGAVAALRELLGSLPDPLPWAWEETRDVDLMELLHRLDWQQLERLLSVLHALSLPSPERPTTSVILELARQPALTERITGAVTAPARRALHEVYVGEGSIDDLLAGWPRPVIRLALLHDLAPTSDAAGVTGAAVEALITSGLAPATWADAQSELLGRAGAVRETAGDRLVLVEPEQDTTGEPHGLAEPTDRRGGAVAPERMTARAAEVLASAREAWARVGAALEAGSSPSDRDLELVEAVGETLKDASAGLTAALAGAGFDETVEPTLPGLRAAQERLEALSLPETQAAHRLGQVAGPADVDEPLGALRAATAGLIERAGVWDAGDRALAGFFLHLEALIDAGADPSTPSARVLQLHNEAVAAAPADGFGQVFLLAVRGALRLPTGDPDDPEDPPPAPPDGGSHDDRPGQSTDADPETTTGLTEETTTLTEEPTAPDLETTVVLPRPAEEAPAPLPAAYFVVEEATWPEPEPTEEAPQPPRPAASAERTDARADTDRADTEAPGTQEGTDALLRQVVEDTDGPDPEPTQEAPETPRPAATAEPAPPMPEPAPPGTERADAEAPATQEGTEALIGRLVGERRFGLAYWLAVADGQPAEVAWLLRVCATAQAVRSPTGAVAGELRRLLEDAPPGALPGPEPLRPLALSVAARACLTAPFSGAAALAGDLAEASGGLPAAAEVALAAAGVARCGIPLLDAGVDVAAGEAEVGRLRARAAELLSAEPDLERERAARVWRRWAAPGGLLGRVVAQMSADANGSARDDRGARVGELLGDLDRLARSRGVEQDLREQDRRLRGLNARPLPGADRSALLGRAEEVLACAREWSAATARLLTAAATAAPDAADTADTAQASAAGPEGADGQPESADGQGDEAVARLREVTEQDEGQEAGAGIAAGTAAPATPADATTAGASQSDNSVERLREVVALRAEDARAELKEWQQAATGLAAGTTAAAATTDADSTESNSVDSNSVDWDSVRAGVGLAAGVAAAAAGLLEEIFGIAAAPRLEGGVAEPAHAREVVGRELLRSDVPLGALLEPREPGGLSVEAVVAAVDRSWEDAFGARMAAGQYGTAALVLEELRARRPERAAELRGDLDAARAHARALAGEHAAALLEDVRLAQRLGVLREADAVDLICRVEATGERDEPNLDLTSAALDAIAADLERLHPGGEEPGGDAAEGTAPVLWGFFPAVPDALPGGITSNLVAAVRERRAVGPLEFEQLTEEQAESAADALAGWREVADGPWHERQLQTLAPALRLCGIEAARGEWLALPRSAQRRWAGLLDVGVTGASPVPEFGSRLRGRMRLLLCWKEPDASTLLDWLEQDASDEPAVVLHFGTIDARRRLLLAGECRRRRPRRPVVVVDDAVLAFAAASGHGRLDPVLRVTLPFGALNPYRPGTGGDVPPELFRGRAREVAEVTAADGAALVSGARQAGVSALLREAARAFQQQPGQLAVYVEVADTPAARQQVLQYPELVWDRIWRGLVAAGVTEDGIGRHDATRVGDAVRAWLDADPERRLLLLLDGCDPFLEGDAATGFANARQLAALREATGGRVKPVLAGQHTAQRFAAAPHQPLARTRPGSQTAGGTEHSRAGAHPEDGRLAPIGPLAPAAAHCLLTGPLRVLGLELAGESVANRILSDCGYQPVRIQLFGHALVEHVLGAGAPVALPQVVDAAAVDAVAASAEGREQVRSTLRRTLDLDGRYAVIAYVLAAARLAAGADAALTTDELRARCDDWWAAGFAGLAPDAFRALLEELTGFEVLADAPGGRLRLAGARLPELLGGTQADAEEILQRADHRQPPRGALAVTERRVALTDAGARSPLTEQQLADVIGEGRDQVRLVLGSTATGVARVTGALRTVARPGRLELLERSGQEELEQALAAPQEPGTHRVVVAPLCAAGARHRVVDLAGCAAALARAASGHPRTRSVSVVVVSGEQDLDWWLELSSPGSRLPDGVEPVGLRRYDEGSLAAWALDGGKAFRDALAQRDLLAVTGGWPLLVDRAAELTAGGATASVTLETIRAELAAPEGARRLVRSAGVGAPPVAPLWDQVVTLGDGAQAPAEDLVEVLADADGWPAAHAGVEVLRALQALPREPDGTLRPEPVLAAAWRRVKA